MKTQASKKSNSNRDFLLTMGIMVAIIATIGIWFDQSSENTYMTSSISQIESFAMHNQYLLPN